MSRSDKTELDEYSENSDGSSVSTSASVSDAAIATPTPPATTNQAITPPTIYTNVKNPSYSDPAIQKFLKTYLSFYRASSIPLVDALARALRIYINRRFKDFNSSDSFVHSRTTVILHLIGRLDKAIQDNAQGNRDDSVLYLEISNVVHSVKGDTYNIAYGLRQSSDLKEKLSQILHDVGSGKILLTRPTIAQVQQAQQATQQEIGLRIKAESDRDAAIAERDAARVDRDRAVDIIERLEHKLDDRLEDPQSDQDQDARIALLLEKQSAAMQARFQENLQQMQRTCMATIRRISDEKDNAETKTEHLAARLGELEERVAALSTENADLRSELAVHDPSAAATKDDSASAAAAAAARPAPSFF